MIKKEFCDLEFRAILEGKKFVLYPKDKWEKALAEREKSNLRDQIMFTTTSLNNEGIELEKAGDIQSAITIYENNVKLYEDNVDIGFLATSDMRKLLVENNGDMIEIFEKKSMKPICRLQQIYD